MNREELRFEVNGQTYDWMWILIDVARYGGLLGFGIALGVAWQAQQGLGAFCGNALVQAPNCGPLISSAESMVVNMALLGGGLFVGSFLLPVLDGGGSDG